MRKRRGIAPPVCFRTTLSLVIPGRADRREPGIHRAADAADKWIFGLVATRRRGMTEVLAHPEMTRAVNGSFTMRVEELFTASHQLRFTNTVDRTVKTPMHA
jgi:hypothetical protein